MDRMDRRSLGGLPRNVLGAKAYSAIPDRIGSAPTTKQPRSRELHLEIRRERASQERGKTSVICLGSKPRRKDRSNAHVATR